jgi:hypothetical protein
MKKYLLCIIAAMFVLPFSGCSEAAEDMVEAPSLELAPVALLFDWNATNPKKVTAYTNFRGKLSYSIEYADPERRDWLNVNINDRTIWVFTKSQNDQDSRRRPREATVTIMADDGLTAEFDVIQEAYTEPDAM